MNTRGGITKHFTANCLCPGHDEIESLISELSARNALLDEGIGYNAWDNDVFSRFHEPIDEFVGVAGDTLHSFGCKECEVGRKFAWVRRKESNGKNSVLETKKKSNFFNH
jgi:hypothetical protein